MAGQQTHRHLPPAKAVKFPQLRREDHHITSEEDGYYNCVSWAIGDGIKDVRYDPLDPMGVWPESLPRNTLLQTFVRLYVEFNGFETCDSGVFEPGFVKVALYSDSSNEFTHVARQLDSGLWTSKLGDWEDIEHADPECLQLGLYGRVRVFLRRKVTA